MAAIRKRGNKYYAEVRRSDFFQGKSFPSKKAAQDWARRVETQLDDGHLVKGKNGRTFADVIDRFTKEVSPTRDGAKWEEIRGKFFKKFKIANIRLNDLTSRHFADYRDERLNKVKPASVRRELNFMSSMLSTAMRDWEWIGHNPVEKISKPKASPPRDRRVSKSEIKIIMRELKYTEKGQVLLKKQQTATLFLLAIETAMRCKEMTTLSWSQIHLDKKYIQLLKSKNGDRRQVPLSTRAIELIKKFEGLHPENMCTVTEGTASSMFYKAKSNAELNDLNFHDSRREACSRLAKKLDVMDLAKMSGHRDIKTLLNVYYKPSAGDIADLLG